MLLLRPQLVGQLAAEQRRRAVGSMASHTALIKSRTGGRLGSRGVCWPIWTRQSGVGHVVGRSDRRRGFFLDRRPVTNREFQQFVAAGGYQEPSIWDPEVWPVVSEFVDRTGAPGPRFWSQGRFEPRLERHPVGGRELVRSSAYARWLGKRLPTDAEWVRAAAAPLLLPGGELRQRKFPWGDKAERSRANLWGANPAGTVRGGCLAVGRQRRRNSARWSATFGSGPPATWIWKAGRGSGPTARCGRRP